MKYISPISPVKKSRFDQATSDAAAMISAAPSASNTARINRLCGLNDDNRVLLRGSGSEQGAHQNSEIVTRDMDEVSFVDVFPTAQPGTAHAATLQNMREAALHNLAAFAHGLLADARSQPVTVRIDRRASLVVAMPTQIAFTRPGLGDARLPWAVVEVFQHIA